MKDAYLSKALIFIGKAKSFSKSLRSLDSTYKAPEAKIEE